MVLEISVEFINPEPPTVVAEPDEAEHHCQHRPSHDIYTVRVDSKRILTVSTADEIITIKWLARVLKSTSSNFKPLNPNPGFRPDAIFVGLTVDMDGGDENNPFVELLTFCIGSHCLMLQLFQPAHYPSSTPKAVKTFFDNPRVVVFARDMANVVRKLKKFNMIEIRNAVDLNQLAVRGMERDDLDLGHYDLDRLAITVLGKHYDVIRLEGKLNWWREISNLIRDIWRVCENKVKFSTVDTYLCWLIGTSLEEAIHGARFSGAGEKKKKTTRRSQ